MGQPYSNNKKEYYADGSPSLEQQIPGNFKNVAISNCLIFNTGTGGIVLDGGDRKKLSPGNNMVYNTEFCRIDRINNTYSPAVKLNGVGNIVRNCYFHDLKHQAIGFMGNDHIIEYSRFDKVCTDADDSGAIYTGRDPSSRGTVIQYNYFSNIEPKDMGPAAGKVLMEIDGIPKDTIYRFDSYCTYFRMSYILVDDLEDKEHEVSFKVLDGPIDKAAILEKRGKVIVNPDDYKDNNWYIGKLLVDGLLIP